MPLLIRYPYPAGSALGISLERLSDSKLFDFADNTFKTTPTTPIQALTAGTGNYTALYRGTIASTPIAQFANGDYALYVHNTASSNALLDALDVTFWNGDSVAIRPDTIGSRILAVRNQDAVTAPTADDAALGAWTDAFGKESVVGTAYSKQKPDNSGASRTFALDSASSPSSRT